MASTDSVGILLIDTFLHGPAILTIVHHHRFRLHLRIDLTKVDIPVIAVLECLAGAACYAVSAVLQQHVASAQPADLSMRPGLILRLVRSGRWMMGNLMDVGGFLFQLLALRRAALALVEPLFVIGLVFSIAGAAIAGRRRPTRSEWWSSSLVVAGLALFISLAQPGPGHPNATGVAWAALFALTALAVGSCVLLATGSGRRRALLLGAGTGILYGVTSAVTERTGHLLNGGILHALSSWAPYTLAVVSVLGLVLNQSAYQAGDLRLSLPLLTVLEPIVAVVIGQTLFDEHINSSSLAILGEVVGLIFMTLGVAQLGRRATPESAKEPAV